MGFHLGRLVDHIHLRTCDLEAARRFYKAIFAVLDVEVNVFVCHAEVCQMGGLLL